MADEPDDKQNEIDDAYHRGVLTTEIKWLTRIGASIVAFISYVVYKALDKMWG